ncbi:MAG: hypothetical protein ABI548_02830 [Polyangiaceae bacterium]
MSTTRARGSLRVAASEAAARVYGCDADDIEIEIDEQSVTKDNRPTIFVNWRDSLKFPKDLRIRAGEAVVAVLPEKYRGYHIVMR